MPVKNPSTTLRAGIIPGQKVTKEKQERARELRREMTPAEKILWEELPPSGTFGGRIGLAFILEGSRSHLHLRAGASVAGFIVDFYCHKAGLVVEVDGDVHDLQQEEDAGRERALSEMGLRVVRFGNDEIVRELSAVVGKIREMISIST